MTDPILNEVLQGAKSDVRIQDDFFRHVNGTWLDTHVIPDDRASDGTFYRLRDQSEDQVKAILDELAEGNPEGEAKKIGDFYSSFMDVDKLNAAGTEPLEADLAPIRDAADHSELAGVAGQLLKTGVKIPVGGYVEADINNPEAYSLYLYQSGLSLPDEAFYRAEQHAETLEAFKAFVPEFMELSGLFGEGAAEQVIDFETKIASVHIDVVQMRDAEKRNNPMTWEEHIEAAPGFDWEAFRTGAGITTDQAANFVNYSPETLTKTAQIWAETDLEVIKNYLTWQVLVARASLLTEAIDKKAFDFFSTKLTGTTTQRERWRRAIGIVSNVLGEALGKIYVSRHFPPEYKEKMEELVADLLEAYRVSINNLDWMGEETKQKALIKLATFNPKIGYPDEWRDYSGLEVGDDLVANVRAGNAFEFERDLAKIGQPMDKGEWHMSPQTVNAYYNPVWNEIVFPAAILQPPFFEMGADDAWNYGGIGAVIGHEIGHGFDDQGSKFDEAGRLNNWWTDQDRSEFEKRTKSLIDQYDAYTPAQLEGSAHHVNGGLTIGENIGDLGGLSIALKAYEVFLARQGKTLDDAPVIDGVTGVQRLFYSYARIWQSKARDEMMITLLSIDPHSPAEFRCNGIVKNMDSFAEAFGVVEGDELYLAPEDRVRIWS